jgi:hypothetical protein
VAAGVLQGGALAGLGLKLSEGFLLLALVFAGAWVLVDIIETVREDGEQDRGKQCQDRWINDHQPRCSKWARGNKAKHRCCMTLARDRFMNCYQGLGQFPLLPWEAGYQGVC